MKSPTVRFDDSLPKLVAVIEEQLGRGASERGTVLRDFQGCLAFFADEDLSANKIEELSNGLRNALGVYARGDRIVATRSDDGADVIRGDSTALSVRVDGFTVRLVDRRIVGADWLRQPASASMTPPRIVFASLKGGVGRSTALAVAANHLSTMGKRVLCIDLDMEAPGLGPVFLTDETLPDFGIIDALVEKGLSNVDDSFYADLVGPSTLAAKGGRIDVVPAFGRRSLRNPGDILAKISRAYIEIMREDGSTLSLLDKVREIVEYFARMNQYDAILIDARAGLHETTASSVLGLGAEVLLFGLDEPQTFHGYSAMFAHLGRLRRSGETPEWIDRLNMIQGKAPADADERAHFAEKYRELFKNSGILSALPNAPLTDAVVEHIDVESNNITWNDDLPDEMVLPPEWSLPEPLAILYDGSFQNFHPLNRRDQLSKALYMATFGQLLECIDSIMKKSLSVEETI